jgi:HlyD family secretion protein
MNKGVLIVGLILTVLVAGCSNQPAATPTSTAISVPTPLAPGARGKLTPRQFVEVGVNSPGTVAEVLVSEGQPIQKGQVLARLDDTFLKLDVQEAQLKLKQAELELEKAQKPADPLDLAAAEKAIQAAQAALVNARGASLTTSQQAENALRSAQLAFDQAQADYNHQVQLKEWGFDVEVKTNALKASQVRYENARADLDIAQRDATGANIRAAEAIVQAQKTLAEAQASYDELKKRPDPESVKAAQLEIESAKVRLSQAEADLEDAALTAPLSGVVAQVALKAGQRVAPGTPLLTLADTSTWYVETDNLTELSVVDVKEGSPVTLKFDAVPGLQLTGHVERIALRGQDQRGDVLYTVRVALDNMDPRLLWGMTAFAQFEK